MSVRGQGEDGAAVPLDDQLVPERAGLERLPDDAALVPQVLQALRALRDGGHVCLPVRGSFPEQFVCVGTADQIRRMFQDGAF